MQCREMYIFPYNLFLFETSLNFLPKNCQTFSCLLSVCVQEEPL